MNSELPNSEAAIFDLHTLGEADSDTQQLLNVSQILRRLVACKTTSKQLLLWATHEIENAIHKGWELEHPQLVIQTLGIAAKVQVKANQLSPVELLHAILETLLPVLDVFAQMQDLQVPVKELDYRPVDPAG